MINGPHTLKPELAAKNSAKTLSCGMQKTKKGGKKGWELLKMVLCYLNFIQPYCVLRYLVSHTSSDCTSVSVAQNHLEYSSTKIMCERILHMRGKTANRGKTLQDSAKTKLAKALHPLIMIQFLQMPSNIHLINALVK